ncbi:hypothetical protein D4764_22G0007160 [Takifugu flavidus]|uniref:Uncharacterized protein n=1 Tax=Takifugu flavidus TaxID=433684 RepID=A0A5C6NEB2_9TELE|nr:hypothetical protein D4764_22G0007160 [Takifugu flavidus]
MGGAGGSVLTLLLSLQYVDKHPASSFQLAVPLVTSPTSPLHQPGVAPVSAEGRTEVKTDTRAPCGPPYGAEELLTPDSAWVERRLPSSLCFYLKPPVLPGVRPALYPRGLLSSQSFMCEAFGSSRNSQKFLVMLAADCERSRCRVLMGPKSELWFSPPATSRKDACTHLSPASAGLSNRKTSVHRSASTVGCGKSAHINIPAQKKSIDLLLLQLFSAAPSALLLSSLAVLLQLLSSAPSAPQLCSSAP